MSEHESALCQQAFPFIIRKEPQTGNPKYIAGIYRGYTHPGRNIPTIFLLYTWGSLFGLGFPVWGSQESPFIHATVFGLCNSRLSLFVETEAQLNLNHDGQVSSHVEPAILAKEAPMLSYEAEGPGSF